MRFLFFLMIFTIPVCAMYIPEEDDLFLEMIQRRTFNYFKDCVNPENGLIPDRSNNFHKTGFNYAPAKTGASGLAFSIWAVGAERGYISHKQAEKLTLNTLRFFYEKIPHEHGFFYHFADMKTGERVWNCELSLINTAMFAAGALHAAEVYQDPEIKKLAKKIFDRIDWKWSLTEDGIPHLFWKPETVFSEWTFYGYSESILIYLLGMAGKLKGIPADSWKKLQRPQAVYGRYDFVCAPPLSAHQLPHVWFDFRNRNDGIMNYFDNSRKATLVNREFCLEKCEEYDTYSENCWGLSNSAHPDGYGTFGWDPGWINCNGTVNPAAAGTSVVFTPAESIAAMRYMLDEYSDQIWGRYGFSESFNLDRNWFCPDAYAVTLGPLFLMIENYRTGSVWNKMNQSEVVKRAFRKAGFK